MKEFTFGILTYNQEKYIVQCLESIKYQINAYGKDVKFNIVISDDCSSDRTIEISTLWIEKNKKLFHGIKIIKNKNNMGIVGNTIQIHKNINTLNFHIMAGDDLYTNLNIFDVLKLNRGYFYLTPICLLKGEIITKVDLRFENFFLTEESHLKDKLLEYLSFENVIAAPGVFYDYTLVDEGMYAALDAFKWIEDVPMWLYFLKKKQSFVKLSFYPHVIYRADTGISTNEVHIRRKEFLEEERYLKETIFIHGGRFKNIPQYIYMKDLNRDCVSDSAKDHIKAYLDIIHRELPNIQEHYDKMRKKGEEFIQIYFGE